jgi:cysteine desulfurase
MSRKIYLDYAAATPVDGRVLEAMKPYFSELFYNPSAIYLSAKSASDDLEAARRTVAIQLGAKPAEIIFTAGATEANNLAIQGVARQFPGGEVLVSSIEHESVIEPAGLFANHQIPVDKHGGIILNELSNLLNDKTVLVSIMLVNNELGTIQPLSDIAKLIQNVRQDRRRTGNRRPLYLHTDAAQAGNYFDLHAARLGIDLLSLNAGKIYGPKQSGALYIKAGTKLQPLVVGGGQEFGLRSGTPNIASVVGLAKALELAQASRHEEQKRVTELREHFEELVEQNIPIASLNGAQHHRAPHIVSLSFPGADNERLLMELDEAGIECAAGSACSASSDQPSHVLGAIGLSDEQARSTLRFSLGKYTTKKDIEQTVKQLVVLTAVNR